MTYISQTIAQPLVYSRVIQTRIIHLYNCITI